MVAKAERGKSMEAEAKREKLMVCEDFFTFMSIHNLTISLVHFLHFSAEGCTVPSVVLDRLVPGTFVLCFGTGREVPPPLPRVCSGGV